MFTLLKCYNGKQELSRSAFASAGHFSPSLLLLRDGGGGGLNNTASLFKIKKLVYFKQLFVIFNYITLHCSFKFTLAISPLLHKRNLGYIF